MKKQKLPLRLLVLLVALAMIFGETAVFTGISIHTHAAGEEELLPLSDLDGDGFYEIRSVSELLILEENFSLFNKKNLELTADLDLRDKGFVQLGSSSLSFSGTLEGNGHTLTLALSGENNVSLFYRLAKGSVVRNLHLAGTVTATGNRAASLAVETQHAVEIVNVLSTVDFTLSAGTNGHGGLVAYAGAASYSGTHLLHLRNVGFAGSFAGEVASAAGLVGSSDVAVMIENSFVAASAPDAQSASTFANGAMVALLGAFHTNTLGTSPAGSIAISALDLTDGTLAHLLGAPWGQTLGTDATPVPGGAPLYASAPCASVFTNDPDATPSAVEHTAGETPCDEWCPACYTYAERETAHNYTVGSSVCTVCHAVPYIERAWDDANACVVSRRRAVTDPTPVTAEMTTLTDGWYVVSGEVVLENRLQVTGVVHLILSDGATLSAKEGIGVTRDNMLFVYGQEKDSGTLTAVGESLCSAIGGEKSSGSTATSGVMVFHGGNVSATTDVSGTAAIGGRYMYGTGAIRILGGRVSATSTATTIGAGSGAYSNGCDVRIYGGYVTAVSGGRNNCAIGGGSTTSADVRVLGGIVDATTASTSQPAVGDRNGVGTLSGGLVIQNGVGSLYSPSMTLTEDLTLSAGETLVVPAGKVLIIPEGATVENGGKLVIEEGGKVTVLGYIANAGEIENAGTLENRGEIGAGAGSSITGNPLVGDGVITCLSHVYGGDCDPDCNQCMEVREGTAPHTFSDVCDDECDTCGSIVVREDAHDWRNGFCTVCKSLMRVTPNASGVYEISNAGQLFRIAAQINRDVHDRENNHGFRDCTVLLTADIDLEHRPWTPIGNKAGSGDSQFGFLGTLDGGGHEIRNLFVAATGDYAGLVGELCGGTVKNLTVRGVIEVQSPTVSYVGTLAAVSGEPDGDTNRQSNVTGIRSYVDVTVAEGVTLAGAKYYGGLVGYVSHDSTVESSSWSGNISLGEGSVDAVGGIVGRVHDGATWIRNCASYGTVTANGTWGGILGTSVAYAQVQRCVTTSPIAFGRTNGNESALRVYYLSDSEVDSIDGTVAASADAFASGAVAHELMSAWGQKLGTDPYPVLGGTKVYPTVFCIGGFANAPDTHKAHDYTTPCGDLCGDCGENAPRTDGAPHVYTDACDVTCDVCLTYTRIPPHDYAESVCTLCGAIDEPKQDAEGYYLIGDKNQLLWFREQVEAQSKTLDARLTADIDLAGVTWEPISYFRGTLDGGGHVIKNLTVDHVGTSAGFICTLYGTVKRLGIENASVFLHYVNPVTTNEESADAGVLVGDIVQGTVSDCFVRGETTVAWEDLTGGISAHLGTLCGKLTAGCTVKNSYVTTASLVGTAANGTVENSYCITDETAVAWGSAVTAADAASGRLTRLLGDAFGQTLGTDALPTFRNETNTVYFGYTSCDVQAQPEMILTNTQANDVRPDHTPDGDGDCTTADACSVCGEEAVAARDAHEARADDGDCTTAVLCLHCDTVVVPAKESHDLIPATLESPATCRTCGKAVGDPLPPPPPPVTPEESTDGEEMSTGGENPDESGENSTEGGENSTESGENSTESGEESPTDPEEQPSESPSESPSEAPSEPIEDPTEEPSEAPTDPDPTPDTPDGGDTPDAPDAPDAGLPVLAVVAVTVGSLAALGGAGFGVWWFVVKKKKV